MNVLEAELASALVGIIVTVLWRIIDRYLPDPNAPSQGTTTATPPAAPPPAQHP